MYERFEKVKLFGIPKNINLTSVLAVKNAAYCSDKITVRNSLGGIYYYLRDALFDDKKYIFELNHDNKYLLFYGKYNCRRDHQKTFVNFSNHFKDADVIYATFLPRKRFRPLRFIMSLLRLNVWLFQLIFRRKRPSFGEIFNALPYIQMCYFQNKELFALNDKKYSFVVVYYDASPDENFVVQLYKNKGVCTATLQHGIFAKKSTIKTITDTAFELSSSISDYYLAWNKYTYDEAIKVGMDSSKIKILGMPKYIDLEEPKSVLGQDNKIFGVILNNSAFDLHNKKLIEIANSFAETYGYSFWVRYHPQMKGNEYNNMFSRFCLGTADNKESIAEFASKISFSIISSSSVFVDLLILKHRAFRLCVNEDDTYSSVKQNSFNNLSELYMLVNSAYDESAFKYLCNSYDTFNNYRSFFDDLLNNTRIKND